MRHAPKTLHVVIVRIAQDGRFVLVEEAKEQCRNLWSLPGGLVEEHESLAEAAMREAMEEAGLVIKPRGILAIQHHRRTPTKDRPYTQWYRYLLAADIAGGTLKTMPDAESLRAQFYAKDEIAKLALRDPYFTAFLDEAAPLLPLSSYEYRGTPP